MASFNFGNNSLTSSTPAKRNTFPKPSSLRQMLKLISILLLETGFGNFSFGGNTTTPAFGATQSTPAFGATSNAPAFGATSNAPAFGATTGEIYEIFTLLILVKQNANPKQVSVNSQPLQHLEQLD